MALKAAITKSVAKIYEFLHLLYSGIFSCLAVCSHQLMTSAFPADIAVAWEQRVEVVAELLVAVELPVVLALAV